MRCEKIGRATLYCGDSRELIASLEGVDAVITDPPYGVNYAGSETRHSERDGNAYLSFEDTRENISEIIVPIVSDCLEKFERLCFTPGRASMFLYPEPRCVGSIHYPSGANYGPWGFICSQPIFYYGKCPYLAKGMGGRPDGFTTTERAEKNGHPCPKPIGQMKWLVNRASLPSDTVFDPFMGSGTTGVAAVTMDRNFIGCEIEPAYFDIACERIRKAQDQGDLFIECAAA
jgi:site-specific DNA-methyltransferase (adenine-specific)